MKKIIQKNELSSEAKASIRTRVISAIVMIALTVPCLIFGGWFWFAFVFAGLVGAAYELTKITPLKGKFRIVIYIIVILLTIAITYYQFFTKLNDAIQSGNVSPENLFVNLGTIDLSEMIIMLVAAVFFIICFMKEAFSIDLVFYFVSMIIVIGLGFQSFLYLRYLPFSTSSIGFGNCLDLTQPIFKYWQSALLILFVLIGVLMNDTGAYFVGILFGKHKMNPRISPKKTWEGFIGGIAVSMICSLLWATLWSIGGFPILPILDHTHWYWVLIASILLPIMGDIGDFVFSAIKRHFGVKDFSQLIPGHGGILDRIDSVIFASAFVAALIVFMVFIGAV